MSKSDASSNCKKRKRCGERVYKFKTFGEQGHPIEFNHGSFRHNVKALLEFGNSETVSWSGMPSCSFQLQVHRDPLSHVLLFVIEEPVELSLNRHCKHCIYVGWGEHIICNKKYHFLVPSKDTLAACLSYEGNSNGAGIEKVMGKLNLIMELQGHILHGVFHSNGFGHLLCINGLEMGSDLPGYQVMDFWDRLCTALQARKVSVKDTSQKKTIDLRLLYGIAYGEPWFARWGYEFGRGSFGVTKQMYQKAIEAIQTIPLCMLAHPPALGNTSSHEISSLVSKYQTLSSHSIKSLSDLIRFMLELKSRLSKESNIDTCNPGILVDTNCRWSIKRVEMATRVIIDSLKRAEFRWISRQEVRDAARAYIGDTGLLDFVLKSLGNHIVGNYLVRRCLNPVTKVLEYCLEDISNANFSHQEGLLSDDSRSIKARYKISRNQLSKDMFYFYKHILKDQTNITMNPGIFATISLASRIILDSKYLFKEYYKNLPFKFDVGLGEKLKLYCTIALSNIDVIDQEVPKKIIAPYECITLGNNATLDELMVEVENCFKEIYWGLRDFMVESIVNLNVNKGSDDSVFRVLKAGSELTIFGGRKSMIHENIFENNNNCVVDCVCGAKEDDGERMVSCDICEVWQHTRCVQIPNNEGIPTIFLCSRCEQEILVLPSIS